MKIASPPLKAAATRPDPLMKLSSVHLGLPVTDLGLGLAETFSHSPVIPAFSLGLAALHGGRAAAFAASALHQRGPVLQHRLGILGGETLLAAGHVLGALGRGGWCLPLLLAGTAVNSVTDMRYRSQWGEVQTGSSSPRLQATDLVDIPLAASYLASGPFPAAGVAAGVGHAALAAGNYLGLRPGDKHSRHCQGFGHAIVALSHLAGAAGAGAWALAPLAGGLIITHLQSQRDSQNR